MNQKIVVLVQATEYPYNMSMCRLLVRFIGCIVLAHSVRGQTVIKWTDPSLPDRTILVKPSAAPDRPARILLHLPGTSGRPIVDNIGDAAILQVGMPALRENEVPANSDLATETWKACLRVRERLKREGHRIDPGPVLLSGSSRGGWIASAISMVQPRGLGGLILFGAGQHPDSATRRIEQRGKIQVFHGTPFKKAFSMYISCGDLDENYTAALSAAGQYRHLGARVSVERFPGVGHVRRISPRYLRWLQVEQAAWARNKFHKENPAPAFFEPPRVPGAADAPTWAGFRRLEHARRDPFARLVSLPVGWAIRMEAMEETDSVRDGLKRRAKLSRLRMREVALFDSKHGLDQWQSLKTAYENLGNTFPETAEHVECQLSALRIGAILKRKKEEARRFDTQPAAKRLRELQAAMNAVQARLKAFPNQKDAARLKQLAQAYAAETARVQRAGQFAIIPVEVELGHDPIPSSLAKALLDPDLAPIENLFEE